MALKSLVRSLHSAAESAPEEARQLQKSHSHCIRQHFIWPAYGPAAAHITAERSTEVVLVDVPGCPFVVEGFCAAQ